MIICALLIDRCGAGIGAILEYHCSSLQKDRDDTGRSWRSTSKASIKAWSVGHLGGHR